LSARRAIRLCTVRVGVHILVLRTVCHKNLLPPLTTVCVCLGMRETGIPVYWEVSRIIMWMVAQRVSCELADAGEWVGEHRGVCV